MAGAMMEVLFNLRLEMTTWFYVGLVSVLAVYFKFTRLWAVRNFDLLALFVLTPGLLLVGTYPRAGFACLLAGSAVWLVRMVLDPLLVRRPALEPNLSTAGLTFVGAVLLGVGTGMVVWLPLGLPGAGGAVAVDEAAPPAVGAAADPAPGGTHGPGFYAVPAPLLGLAGDSDDGPGKAVAPRETVRLVFRAISIVGHVAVIVALVLIAWRHFESASVGVAMATLYLLVPYTAYFLLAADQVLPAALIVWAVVCYRWPVVAGALLGGAVGALPGTAFVLPCWMSFYWGRGARRFGAAALGVVGVVVAVVVVWTGDFRGILEHRGGVSYWLQSQLAAGPPAASFWADHPTPYRLPVFIVFLILSGLAALWPPQKDLGHVIAMTAAVLIGTQFWYTDGAYVLWYLPLVVLVIFRPNLAERRPAVAG